MRNDEAYSTLINAVIMPRVNRYKELVVAHKTNPADESIMAEIKELDEYFRSPNFKALTGFNDLVVEAMIDGLRTGGKYFKFRPQEINLYKGKKYR